MMMLDSFDTRISGEMIFLEIRHLSASAKEGDALATGNDNEPLRKACHIPDSGQPEIQFQTDLLENHVGVALVRTQQSRYRVDQPLVTPNYFRSCGLLSIQPRDD